MTRETVLRYVRESTDHRAKAEQRAAAYVHEQAERIRLALALGVPTAELMAVTGLSRARIYQIRDNRR